MGDEAHAGRRGGMAQHARGVDAFGPPQFEEGIAHPVLAEARQVAGPRALAGGGNRDILRIAAESLQPGASISLLGTVKLDERLAEGDDGWGTGHASAGFPWHRNGGKQWPTTRKSPLGPTSRRASPSPRLPTAPCLPAMSATMLSCWRATARTSLPSVPPARTITARWPRACSTATRCTVPGITPASACAPV